MTIKPSNSGAGSRKVVQVLAVETTASGRTDRFMARGPLRLPIKTTFTVRTVHLHGPHPATSRVRKVCHQPCLAKRSPVCRLHDRWNARPVYQFCPNASGQSPRGSDALNQPLSAAQEEATMSDGPKRTSRLHLKRVHRERRCRPDTGFPARAAPCFAQTEENSCWADGSVRHPPLHKLAGCNDEDFRKRGSRLSR